MNKQSLIAILDMAEFHDNAGHIEEAKAICGQVLVDAPDCIEALFLLGNIAHREGQFEESVELFTRAAAIDPENPVILNNLGNALASLKKLDEAAFACRKAITFDPGYSLAWYNLGEFECLLGNHQEALKAFRRCIELTPDRVEAYIKLGEILAETSVYSEALAAFRSAENLPPCSHVLYMSLANLLKFMGRTDEALTYYSKVAELIPDNPLPRSSMLLTMLNSPALTPEEIFLAHQAWAEHFADPIKHPSSYCNDVSPDRKLRIGYVSGDFRAHPIAFFIEPILSTHDRTQFSIHVYADLPSADLITEQLKVLVDFWRPTNGLTDVQAFEIIQKDAIDILIDLSGHTVYNRLLLFARKPAPVQVSWLGYAATTGLHSIDYRITDGKADPPGMTEQYHSENLYRLPDCFICYRQAVGTPDIGPLPARGKGWITFAAFNHFSKVTPETIATWSQILAKVSGSRLMIKSHGLDHEDMQRDVRGMFERHGISPDRLELYGRLPGVHGHLDLFNQVDISLDTFPYNGTTTTCESLWMGVPVITLAGTAHVSRVGVSLLTSVGLTDMIASDRDDYVARAVSLAGNLDLLDLLRTNLRGMMLRSPLLDTIGFTRNLEAAYRAMWQQWCQAQPQSAP